MISKTKLEFESSLINDFAFSNNNRIFKYISLFSKNLAIPAKMYYNDKCCSDNFGIAQLFIVTFIQSSLEKHPHSVGILISPSLRIIYELLI